MATEEEMSRIDPYMHGHYVGSLSIPLKEGKISNIKGLDAVLSNPYVTGYVQYYHEGDEIRPEAIGTLAQHFCRVKMMTSSVDDYCELVSMIQDSVKITDSAGQDMIYRRFDIARLKNS